MRLRWLVAGVLLLAVCVAYFLGRAGTTPGNRPEAAARQNDYGYVALDARVVQTDDTGQVLYTLDAAQVAQDPGSGELAANTLTLHYGLNGLQPWTLGARSGRLPSGSTRVHLEGDVQARGKPAHTEQFVQINTQQVDFDMAAQELTTHQPVTVNWGGQQLAGRGLSANLKQGQLRLESSVHGRFSP